MPEFEPYDLSDLQNAVVGKTISGVSLDDSGSNNVLVFSFTDGTSARIEYDWIYEWDLDNDR